MNWETHCIFQRGESPIVAAAIHNGHLVSSQVEEQLAIRAPERLREEDPFTGALAQVAENQIVGLRSRFEVDLNRARDKAVYLTQDDAWGMAIWRSAPGSALIQASLTAYDTFYKSIGDLLAGLVRHHGHAVVLDIHSYNHRRNGINAPAADQLGNPDINIGTGTLDKGYWYPIVDAAVGSLSKFSLHGRPLDVRENVKFQGGHFSKWIHESFPRQVCVIAIEFKKIFMDEWTGEPDLSDLKVLYEALESCVAEISARLEQL